MYVKLRNIRKSYGSLEVIHGVDLDIGLGEFCVFVGPSGCGKSTLMRMIAGLEDITAGTIEIDGEVVNDKEPADRGVAMVFQNYALYPHMSVRKNMEFGLRMTGHSRQVINERIAQAAHTLQIESLLDRKPANLSGGQRQRVAIGRAIVRDPKVFLFDEPLSNLDAELRVTMRAEIAQLHARLSNTMIYVTHDQTEAMTLADRIVVVRDGTIEQVGTPLELYEDPDNTFVGGFLGSPRMNFIPATVTDTGARLICGTDIRLPTLKAPPVVGQEIQIGIRPEHMNNANPDAEQLSRKVALVEELGGVRYLHAEGAGAEPLIIERRDREPRGEYAKARFHKGDIRVFAADGARIR